mmetsp:Transcript_63262/g.193526  ORF Transcript_63262/g.193526 Transcript_63262/m.193526 type:complete len:782 (+) Transcript_63262:405-2750(+)
MCVVHSDPASYAGLAKRRLVQSTHAIRRNAARQPHLGLHKLATHHLDTDPRHGIARGRAVGPRVLAVGGFARRRRLRRPLGPAESGGRVHEGDPARRADDARADALLRGTQADRLHLHDRAGGELGDHVACHSDGRSHDRTAADHIAAWTVAPDRLLGTAAPPRVLPARRPRALQAAHATGGAIPRRPHAGTSSATDCGTTTRGRASAVCRPIGGGSVTGLRQGGRRGEAVGRSGRRVDGRRGSGAQRARKGPDEFWQVLGEERPDVTAKLSVVQVGAEVTDPKAVSASCRHMTWAVLRHLLRIRSMGGGTPEGLPEHFRELRVWLTVRAPDDFELDNIHREDLRRTRDDVIARAGGPDVVAIAKVLSARLLPEHQLAHEHVLVALAIADGDHGALCEVLAWSESLPAAAAVVEAVGANGHYVPRRCSMESLQLVYRTTVRLRCASAGQLSALPSLPPREPWVVDSPSCDHREPTDVSERAFAQTILDELTQLRQLSRGRWFHREAFWRLWAGRRARNKPPAQRFTRPATRLSGALASPANPRSMAFARGTPLPTLFLLASSAPLAVAVSLTTPTLDPFLAPARPTPFWRLHATPAHWAKPLTLPAQLRIHLFRNCNAHAPQRFARPCLRYALQHGPRGPILNQRGAHKGHPLVLTITRLHCGEQRLEVWHQRNRARFQLSRVISVATRTEETGAIGCVLALALVHHVSRAPAAVASAAPHTLPYALPNRVPLPFLDQRSVQDNRMVRVVNVLRQQSCNPIQGERHATHSVHFRRNLIRAE